MVIRLEVYNGVASTRVAVAMAIKQTIVGLEGCTIETGGVGGGGDLPYVWKGAFGS